MKQKWILKSKFKTELRFLKYEQNDSVIIDSVPEWHQKAFSVFFFNSPYKSN